MSTYTIETFTNKTYENEVVVGFEYFEDAILYAKENEGTEVVLLYKRDGDRCWTNKGYTLEGIEVKVEDFGSDYHAYTDEDLDDFFNEEVHPALENSSMEEAEECFANFKEVYEHLLTIDETQYVIVCGNKYYDTMDKIVCSYNYDVHSYMIGVATIKK